MSVSFENFALPLWERLEKETRDLFVEAVHRAGDLEAQVKELEQEVAAYKAAFGVAAKERDEARGVVENLQTQLRDINDYNPLAVTIIDGDGYIFSPELVEQGKVGGQRAASILCQELSTAAGRQVQIYAVIYLSRTGLSDLLLSNDLIADKPTFDEFIVGFNQASPFLSIVDVGKGKEAADSKVKEMLALFSHFPQVKRIFFGGAHDGGYAHALTSLKTEGLLHKVSLLSGHTQTSSEIQQLDLPSLNLGALFMGQRLSMRPQSRVRSVTTERVPSPSTASQPVSIATPSDPKKKTSSRVYLQAIPSVHTRTPNSSRSMLKRELRLVSTSQS